MDYMSPEQQLLYLFDYACTHNRASNISASHQTDGSYATNVTNALTAVTDKSYAYTAATDTSMHCADALSERMPSLSTQPPPPPPPQLALRLAVDSPRSPLLSPASTRAVTHSPKPTPKQLDYAHSGHPPPLHPHRDRRRGSEHIWRVSNTETRSHAQAIADDICYVTSANHHNHNHNAVTATAAHTDADADGHAITPFNKLEHDRHLESTAADHHYHHHHAYDEFIDVDHDAIGDDSPLLEIPASLTAEESAVCCIDIEDTDGDDDDGDAHGDGDDPNHIFTLLVNDEEWRKLPKISHRLRHDHDTVRRTKLQCTV